MTVLAHPVGAAVLGPPSISKSFDPATIGAGGTSTLTLELGNPNGLELTGVAVTDFFPAGLVVAGTPSPTVSNCGAATFTALANATSISLSGATIAGSGTCTVSVLVSGTTVGAKVNTTGPVSSANAGSGDTATATLLVQTPQGGACSDAAQCFTGFCVDGVCCNTACSEPFATCDAAGQVGICTSTVADAPALSPVSLFVAALVLSAIAGLSLYRRA